MTSNWYVNTNYHDAPEQDVGQPRRKFGGVLGRVSELERAIGEHVTRCRISGRSSVLWHTRAASSADQRKEVVHCKHER